MVVLVVVGWEGALTFNNPIKRRSPCFESHPSQKAYKFSAFLFCFEVIA